MRNLGMWDAAANFPPLASGNSLRAGDYYVVCVPGNSEIDGVSDWHISDRIQFNGACWEKVVTDPDEASEYTRSQIDALLAANRQPRVQSVASAATVTPNADTTDCVDVTAQAVPLTIANCTGSPVNFQTLKIRILDNGVQRSITWGNGYVAGGQSLPANTTAGKTVLIGLEYSTANGLNNFRCVAVSTEA